MQIFNVLLDGHFVLLFSILVLARVGWVSYQYKEEKSYPEVNKQHVCKTVHNRLFPELTVQCN